MNVSDLSIGREIPASGAASAAAGQRSQSYALPSHHLVTHGVVLGMTGSGKTGLAIVMVEEALRAGIPVLAVDIKGDLPNLLLTFPSLDGPSFAPWIDPEAASREGKTVDEVAAATADRWRAQLGEWELDGGDVEAFRARVAPRIVTPGASIGEPLDVLSSLSSRSSLWDDDPEAAHDQLGSAISLVLRLAGGDGDPRTREHVVLTTLALRRLEAGQGARLDALLTDLLEPPIDRIGVMAFEQFLPPKEQQALAQKLNALLASPKLASWLRGSALDVRAWLERRGDKTPLTIFSVAHLDDEERQLVLGLLLDELLSHVRSLSGSTSLRALVVFDEVYGFLPPHPANPPTKKPLLTLLKQARAFGVGVLLATQNPMDLDYKALSNAGAWFIGRLQTDADRERVVEGLSGSDGGLGGLEPAVVASVLRNLPPRTFFVRDVHKKPSCALLQVRAAMSWLRGPVTRRELTRLHREHGGAKAAEAAAPAAGAKPATAGPEQAAAVQKAPSGTVVMTTPIAAAAGRAKVRDKASTVVPDAVPPAPPAGWATYFGRSKSGAAGGRCSPYLAATLVVRARDAKIGLSLERKTTVVAPFDAAGRVDRSRAMFVDPAILAGPMPPGSTFAPLPDGLSTKKDVQAAERAMRDHAATSYALVVDVHRDLKLFRADGETQEAFAARCRAEADRRAREEQTALTAKSSSAFAKLQSKLEAKDRELAAAQQAEASAPSDFASAIVGFAIGKQVGSRMHRDRARANADHRKAYDAAMRARDALEQAKVAYDAEVRALYEEAARTAVAVESVRMLPKKGDVEVTAIGLAWFPEGA
ncbi:MAG: ATP-binding protein [Polyangiaceae bacterium]|nr:ATP-binding protein [Polyangiaceae bacterium]